MSKITILGSGGFGLAYFASRFNVGVATAHARKNIRESYTALHTGFNKNSLSEKIKAV